MGRQCYSCGGVCGGGYTKDRKYIPCKSTASPVSAVAQLTERDVRIQQLEAENERLRAELFTCWRILKSGTNTPEDAAYVFDIPEPPTKGEK